MKVDKRTDDLGHVGDVTSVFIHKNHVYSAGSDGKIKVKISFHKLTKKFLEKVFFFIRFGI